MNGKPLVLILCTGNSARSQMAEAFLRKYAGDRFEIASAGTQPQPQVHPLAVRVMEEIGIDISDRRPKDIAEFLGRAAVRHLIIVCDRASSTCPRVWPGTYTRQDMPVDDPAAATGSEQFKLEEFRRVRDEIDHAMKHWQPKVQRAGE